LWRTVKGHIYKTGETPDNGARAAQAHLNRVDARALIGAQRDAVESVAIGHAATDRALLQHQQQRRRRRRRAFEKDGLPIRTGDRHRVSGAERRASRPESGYGASNQQGNNRDTLAEQQ